MAKKEKRGVLYTQTGVLIEGTLENIHGCVAVLDGVIRKNDGTFEIEYGGTTRVNWDDQRTVVKYGQRQFVAEDGQIWSENELVFEDAD